MKKIARFILVTIYAQANIAGAQIEVSVKPIEKLNNIETSYPYWSPDGTKIVLQSDRNDDDSEIYTMDITGKNLKRLTQSKDHDESPIWSPDGKSIIFSSGRDGNYEIYVMDADGANQRNVSNHPSYDGHPNISPDGKKIIFNSNRIMPPENYDDPVLR